MNPSYPVFNQLLPELTIILKVNLLILTYRITDSKVIALRAEDRK